MGNVDMRRRMPVRSTSAVLSVSKLRELGVDSL